MQAREMEALQQEPRGGCRGQNPDPDTPAVPLEKGLVPSDCLLVTRVHAYSVRVCGSEKRLCVFREEKGLPRFWPQLLLARIPMVPSACFAGYQNPAGTQKRRYSADEWPLICFGFKKAFEHLPTWVCSVLTERLIPFLCTDGV